MIKYIRNFLFILYLELRYLFKKGCKTCLWSKDNDLLYVFTSTGSFFESNLTVVEVLFKSPLTKVTLSTGDVITEDKLREVCRIY